MNSTASFPARFARILATIISASFTLASSHAEVTYSVNALGYVDANFVAGSNLIANPLFGGDNSVSNLFRGLPDGTVFLPCAHGSNSFGPSNVFTFGSGWTAPSATFIAPDTGFLVLPAPRTITFIGQPWSLFPGPVIGGFGGPCLGYPSGESFSGWFTTVVCPIAFCLECDPPPRPYSDGTVLVLWNRQTQAYGPPLSYIEFLRAWQPYEPVVGLTEGVRILAEQSFGVRDPFGGAGPTPSRLPWLSVRNPQRGGTNLTFDLPATSGVDYAVFCSTNLNTGSWQLAQEGTAMPANGVATVSVSGTNSGAYYRVLPQFGASAVLLGGARGASNFAFQLYAPIATNYVVQRTLTLSKFSNPTWQTITNVTAGPSNIVSVVDTTATADTGYYRVYY